MQALFNTLNVSKSNRRPVDPTAEAIGARLREVREALKLSGQALADAVGVSKATVSNIENGRYWIGGDMLHYLASAHGVREGYIMRGEGSMFEKDDAPKINLDLRTIDIQRFESVEAFIRTMRKEIDKMKPEGDEEEGEGVT